MKKDAAPVWFIDLKKVELADAGEGKARVRIPLLQMGRYFQGRQKFSITRKDVIALRDNFRKRPNGEVVIDYEHASEMRPTGQPVPAAGWLKAVDDEPDQNGVLWGEAEFTDRARQMIETGEYRYVSPAMDWTKRDKHTGDPQGATFTSVALVNKPFQEWLPAIALSDGWKFEPGGENNDAGAPATKEKQMDKTKVTLADGNGQSGSGLAAVVICGECGKETNCAVEIPKAAQPKVIQLSDVQRTQDGRFNFDDIQTGADVLIAGEVFHARRVQDALDAAVQKGKITPAQRPKFEKLALSDFNAFTELVESMPQQVELGERGVAGTGSEAGAKTEIARIDAQLEEKAKAKSKAEGIPYGNAYKLVLSENPDLAGRRAQLMRD